MLWHLLPDGEDMNAETREEPLLGRVVDEVIGSRKYAGLCPDTVRRLAVRERAAHPRAGLKELVKAVKRGLHQVYGAFEAGPDYEAAYRGLAAAHLGGEPGEIRAACRAALELHSSTRERLPILDEFYAHLFAITGVPGSILDLACGLNPLSLPWMDLAPAARYEAFDIEAAGIQFLNRYLLLAGRGALAHWQDVLARPPEQAADLVLLLKASATLERQEKGATARLIAALNAPRVVVSFAVASLGGRDRGMPAHYRAQFLPVAEAHGWAVKELPFATELVFVVLKS